MAEKGGHAVVGGGGLVELKERANSIGSLVDYSKKDVRQNALAKIQRTF